MTWRRLGVLIRHLSPKSAVYRAVYPESADWSTTDYLLASANDLLAAGNWQRGNAGAKQPSAKPKPMYRPPAPGTPKRKSMDDRIAEWKARHCRDGGTE